MPEAVKRTKVFISYSHEDLVWLQRLRVHLKPLERDFEIDIWDDGKIKPGSKWKAEIAKTLLASKVAVLLISADFLASDFINENELPPLLEAAERDGAIILPVIISPSRFVRTQSLAQYQSVNAPTNPLIKMTKGDQEDVFVAITEYIETALESVRKSSVNKPRARARVKQPKGEQHQSVIGRVPLIVYYHLLNREDANKIYSMLQGKGMSPNTFASGLALYGARTIVYSAGYEAAAYWLRDNITQFKDFSVVKLSPGDTFKGIIIDLW